jgi:hypothetical protein
MNDGGIEWHMQEPAYRRPYHIVLLIVSTSTSFQQLSTPYDMESKPHKFSLNRIIRKIGQPFKPESQGQSQERATTGHAQPQDSLGVDHPNRPSSVPPKFSQESSQPVDTSSSTIAVTQSLVALRASVIDLLSGAPSTGQAPPTVNSIGPTEVLKPLSPKPSPAMQTAKFIGKGLLGLLSSAADGVPVPGVKGIFDTIINVVKIIEVRHIFHSLFDIN